MAQRYGEAYCLWNVSHDSETVESLFLGVDGGEARRLDMEDATLTVYVIAGSR